MEVVVGGGVEEREQELERDREKIGIYLKYKSETVQVPIGTSLQGTVKCIYCALCPFGLTSQRFGMV